MPTVLMCKSALAEWFVVSLVKAIGRGIGGPFGKALTGPHHRRKQWWQK